MSIIRTSLLTLQCLGSLPGATANDHPLYFEQRSAGLFETRDAGKIVAIRPDRIELDGVTLRFVHAFKSAQLDGLGPSAPSTYIIANEIRSFRQYPKARIRHIYPGIDVTLYGTPGHLEYDLDLARGAAPHCIQGASWTQATPLINAISVDQIDPSRTWVATSLGLFSVNSAGQLAGLNEPGLAVAGNGHVNAASVEISPVVHRT